MYLTMLSTLDATAWVRRGDWIVYLFPWHQNPKPRGIEPLTEGYAADSVESWFPIDDHHWYFTRWDLSRLFQETTGIRGDLYLRSTPELRRWLQRALLDGEVVAYLWRPMDQAESFASYATYFGISLGKPLPTGTMRVDPVQPVGVVEDGPQYTRYVGHTSTAERENVLDETCPSANWRSESYETASPEVREWLDKYITKKYRYDPKSGTDYYNDTLGFAAGGGFLQTTTRVAVLAKGSTLCRFHDGKGADGSWWFREPIEGDPVVYAALPPGSDPKEMVMCRVNEEVEVLEGIGAPRCSNKPGGPVQLCIPRRHVKHWMEPRITLL